MLDALGAGRGPPRSFALPIDPAIPRAGPGIYTVWDGEGRFLYVGVAGAGGGKGGLAARLTSHASGRRLGDQFCVHVADRRVLPRLSAAEIEAIAEGRHSLDALTRAFIRRHLAYRWAALGTGDEAKGWEATLRRGAWAHGPPLLNPAATSGTAREARDPGTL